jgi:hypothetical protein
MPDLTRKAPPEHRSKIRFEARIVRAGHLASRNDDQVEPALIRGVDALAENLSNQSLSSVSDDGVPELPAGDDPQPDETGSVGCRDDGDVAPLNANSAGEGLLEVLPAQDASRFRQSLRRHARKSARPGSATRRRTGGRVYDADETVSRFRPFARRRFNTSRPFFVLMRTRKPWVRRRRRRLGWNVRFMTSDPLQHEPNGGET